MKGLMTTLVLALVLASCGKTDSQPDLSTKQRNLEGKVLLFDDKGNASVNVIGVTLSASNGSQTFTTSTIQGGQYVFEGLPYGKYVITVSNAGYGTVKRFGVAHTYVKDSANLPRIIPDIKMTMLSTTVVTYYAARVDATNFMFNVRVSPEPFFNNRGYVRFFIGKDSTVSDANYEGAGPSLDLTSNSSLISLPKDVLINGFGFKAGDTGWLKLYGDATPSNEYFDSTLNRMIFPCLNRNTVPAVSFIIP
jgi:hypothetical protein